MQSIDAGIVEEELPLPSFAELFGECGSSSGKKRKKSAAGAGNKDSDEASGRWTDEEHRLFLEGVMLYGKDWKKMQPLIKTRSLVQIRTHAQKVFKKVGLRKFMEAGVSRVAGASNEDDDDDEGLEQALTVDHERLAADSRADHATMV